MAFFTSKFEMPSLQVQEKQYRGLARFGFTDTFTVSPNHLTMPQWAGILRLAKFPW